MKQARPHVMLTPDEHVAIAAEHLRQARHHLGATGASPYWSDEMRSHRLDAIAAADKAVHEVTWLHAYIRDHRHRMRRK
jgi:hypothetical protein